MTAGRDAVNIVGTGGFPVHVPEVNNGTGEGLVRLFMPPVPKKKDEVLPATTTRALVNESEVSNMDALGGRTGATVVPTLLKMWSGEQAGFNNASADTRTNVDAHTYRLGMITQIQPTNAPAILKYEGSGLPQRYVWLPAWIEGDDDWTAEEVAPLKVQIPTPSTRTVMELPPAVAAYVVSDYRQRSARAFDVDADPLEGHHTMLHIKLACALALLDGRDHVTMEDWELARLVMVKHSSTLELVRSELAVKARWEAEQRAEGQRSAELERQERLEQRARQHVLRHLERGQGVTKVRACEYAAKSDIRKLVGDVFAALEAEELIGVENDGTRATSRVIDAEGKGMDRVREWSNRSM